jgi:serine/threonine protein kinase
VMEFLNGPDLERIVRENGPLSEDETGRVLGAVGDALGLLHGENLLHQDIKPENLIREASGRVVLIDFSLSKKLDTASGLQTVAFDGNTRAGTPGYAPLEQYGRQSRVGIYTDIYALAATGYFLLTGQTPTEATDRAAGAPLTDVRALRGNLNPAFGEAIRRALAMNPDERPQSAKEFLELLNHRAALSPAPKRVPAPLPSAPVPRPQPRPEPRREPPIQSAPQPQPRRRTLDDLERLLRNFPPMRMPIPQRIPQRISQPRPRSGCRLVGCPCGCGCVSMLLVLFLLFSLLGGLFSGGVPYYAGPEIGSGFEFEEDD